MGRNPASPRLITDEKEVDDLMDKLREAKLWGNIRHLAKKDPEMKELMEKCIMYYHLKKENNGH